MFSRLKKVELCTACVRNMEGGIQRENQLWTILIPINNNNLGQKMRVSILKHQLGSYWAHSVI